MNSTSWTTEFGRAFKNSSDLFQFLGWENASENVTEVYPLFVPFRMAQRIKDQGPESILAKQFLPHSLELDQNLNALGLEDPIGDQNFNKAPQLIHRYKSRALFTATSICPIHCRYCFRKNELNHSNELFQAGFEETLNYLKSHPEISEIIFTGGDPFTLSNEKLSKYLMSFAEIKSIKDIRFHTRYPVSFPERIDVNLIQLLTESTKKFRTVSVAIHANHADEFDVDAKEAISKLNETGVQLLSQSVLLKGINDHSYTLKALYELFIELKIRPYYLHHPDRVKGGMHFYLPLQTGREIFSDLRRSLPGWALPQYVVDVPGGKGKVSAWYDLAEPEQTTLN